MTSLRHALLAQLNHGPATGYALSRAMRRPVGAMWHAVHSQVYPELARMNDAGLVTHTSRPGRGPRPTKTYRLTEAGWAELAAWLANPTEPRGEQDAFALKVYAGSGASSGQLRTLAEQERQLHRRTLETYEASPLYRHPPGAGSADFHRFAALMLGVSYERHRIAWCEWYLQQLDAAGAGPNVRP